MGVKRKVKQCVYEYLTVILNPIQLRNKNHVILHHYIVIVSDLSSFLNEIELNGYAVEKNRDY